MEGIFDGAARDGCFLCELLFPKRYADDCPECGKRMRYHSAEMADSPAVSAGVALRIEEFRRTPTVDTLRELCLFVHRYWPDSQGPLRDSGSSADALREHWHALH